MNILDFANPLNLWWGLLAIPIIALYILKVRLRRIPASTLLFWNQLYDEKKPRSWWQRLRHWLSLLLQLAFLLLIVAALIDPLWSWQKDSQRRIVLILDNSASMKASTEDGTSRLEAAKRSAITTVRSLRDGDQMALVAAGGNPQVVWGMTNHQRWLVDAINELPSLDAPSKISDSVALAKRLLTGLEGEGETIVITDGCDPDLETLAEDVSVKFFGVGEEQANVGITRYQVRRSLIDAIGYQVLVDVTNYADTPAEVRLELDLEGELVDVLPLKLEPNETLTRVVNHTSVAGGKLNASLDFDDALEVDNSALAILPIRSPIEVNLFSQGNLFVSSVLSSIPLVALSVEQESLIATRSGIQVFDQKVPKELPPGPVLVVDPQNDCSLWKIVGDIDQPIVAKVATESPLTQHIRLDNVLFPGAKELQFTSEVDGLVQDPYDTPMLTRIPRPGGDVVVLSCSLEKGDLPLRIAFPVLMKNTIEWFEGQSSQLRPAATAGDLVFVDIENELRVTPPANSAKTANKTDNLADSSSADQDGSKVGQPAEDGVTVEDAEPDAGGEDDTVVVVAASQDEDKTGFELVAPDGTTSPVATGTGQATIGPMLYTGLWTLRPVTESEEPDSDTLAARSKASPNAEASTEGNSESATEDASREDSGQAPENAGELNIACNLVSPNESDLRPRVDLLRVDDVSGSVLGGRSIWFYLTLLAAGLIASEWWLYQRRIVG